MNIYCDLFIINNFNIKLLCIMRIKFLTLLKKRMKINFYFQTIILILSQFFDIIIWRYNRKLKGGIRDDYNY